MISILRFVLLFLLLTISVHAFDRSISDIIIDSQNMNIDYHDNHISFFGRVVFKQGNIIISTSKLTTFFHYQKVKEIYFPHNVRLQLFDCLVVGDTAKYTDNILSIVGNIIYTSGNNRVTGDIFTYDFRTKVSKISSQKNKDIRIKKRVKLILNIKDHAVS